MVEVSVDLHSKVVMPLGRHQEMLLVLLHSRAAMPLAPLHTKEAAWEQHSKVQGLGEGLGVLGCPVAALLQSPLHKAVLVACGACADDKKLA